MSAICGIGSSGTLKLRRSLAIILLLALLGTAGCGDSIAARWQGVLGTEVNLPVRQATDAARKSADGGRIPRFGTPWLLVPFYARCPRTCSPVVENVRRAADRLREHGVDFRVVLLSVDPQETDFRLESFRSRLRLPDDWLLLRASNRAELHDLLLSLKFITVPLSDGEFDHPNVVYVLSPENRVVGVHAGLVPDPFKLERDLRRATAVSSSGRELPLIALLGMAALAFGLGFLWWVRRLEKRALTKSMPVS